MMKLAKLLTIISLLYIPLALKTADGAEFRINTYTTSQQTNPSLAYDGTNYLVTWMSYGQGGSGYEIYGHFIDKSGAAIGSDFRINSYTTGDKYDPALEYDGTNYLVTWSSNGQDGSYYGVYGQLISTSGAKVGSEFRINTHTASDQHNSALACDGTNYLVTWMSNNQDGNNYGIYGQMIGTNGAKVGSEFRVNTYTASWQEFPALAYNGTNYLVTWCGNGQADGWGVYGQLINKSGTKVGSEFLINTYLDNYQWYQSIASDGNNFMVAWCGQGQDDGSGVYGQLIGENGTKIGSEFLINTYITGSQYNPSLAYDGTNYLVTWHSLGQDGSDYGIFGQLFDKNGDKIGSEFQLNTYTTGIQSYPSVASDGTNFLVAWMSDGQDGSNNGIYGEFVKGNNPVPEPLSVILLGYGLLLLNRRFASRN